MLKAMRRHTKTVIWVVIVSFVLWGGFSLGISIQKKGRYAGEIFGKPVTFQEFHRFGRATRLFSKNENEDPELLRQETWKNLIYSREAARQGIRVSDDDVRQEIRRLFADMGVKDLKPEFYRAWLKSQLRETPQEFEKQIRAFLMIQKLLQQVYEAPESVSREDALERFLKDGEKRVFSVIRLPDIEKSEAFHQALESGQDWQETLKTFDTASQEKTELLTIGSFLKKYELPPAFVSQLYQLAPGSYSRPVPAGDAGLLFRVDQMVQPNVLEFNADMENRYKSLIEDERSRLRLLQWHLDLIRRSGWKDYTQEEDSP